MARKIPNQDRVDEQILANLVNEVMGKDVNSSIADALSLFLGTIQQVHDRIVLNRERYDELSPTVFRSMETQNLIQKQLNIYEKLSAINEIKRCLDKELSKGSNAPIAEELSCLLDCFNEFHEKIDLDPVRHEALSSAPLTRGFSPELTRLKFS